MLTAFLAKHHLHPSQQTWNFSIVHQWTVNKTLFWLWTQNVIKNTLTSNASDFYFFCDVVDMFVLPVDLAAHVHSHNFQVADDAAHCPQVLLHLIFSCIVGYSAQ